MSTTAWLLVPALPLLWLLSGYPLAARITPDAAAPRLARAVLTGLCIQLLVLGIANLLTPLSTGIAWLCVCPVLLTLAHRRQVSALWHDFITLLATRNGSIAATLTLATLALLLLPNLTRPDLVYYDATANHDGYFWIAGAKHLQAHTYLETAATDPVHPWANLAAAFTGWQPKWGRAGAETFLAQSASLAALDPAEAYLAATAALLAVWLAAVYLVARTFWLHRMGTAGVVALTALQPLFFFFRANGNLPNLIGALAATAAFVAVADRLRANSRPWPSLFALVLALHAGLFAYPEIFPFVLLPCGLLLLRALRQQRRLPAASVVGAGVVALFINPATTVRAFHGFAHAFKVGRANTDWVDTFASLHFGQYVPAFATLSLPEAIYLGDALCLFVGAVLLAVVALALARARDRYAAVASLSGGMLLVTYTLATGFNYGWQKSAQFSAVFLAAMLPVAAAQTAMAFASERRTVRWAARTLGVAVAAIFATAMVFHALEAQKWSHRKGISRHWFALRALTHNLFNDAPVVVDAATFPMAFFHGMWASYFMPDVRLSYAPRGKLNGGYLRRTVATLPENVTPAAVLVSRDWAATFDSDSPWVLSGGGIALLTEQNVVSRLRGFLPENGVPESAGTRLELDVRPYKEATLQLSLAPLAPAETSPAMRWRIHRHSDVAPDFVAEIDGAGPWNFVVPLAAAASNRIELTAAPGSQTSFRVTALRIVSSR